MIQQIGKYRIEDKLGEGSMGSVYKAYDSILGQNVAIKILADDIQWTPELKQQFFREAQTAAGLIHPNIVTINEAGAEENIVFIIMEYLQGNNLKEIIRNKIPISLEEKLSLMIQAADGLNYAHSGGYIHQDVKPGNIFITSAGLAKIMDFGITCLSPANLTRPVDNSKTSTYMSPEQIRGEKCDVRSDLFSYGIVLYEFLAHVHPFQDSSLEKTKENILNQYELPLAEQFPGAPPGLLSILNTCLEKEPSKRYAGMNDMSLACRRLLDDMDQASQRMKKGIAAYIPRLYQESQKPNAPAKLIQLYNEAQSIIDRGQPPDYLELLRFTNVLSEEPLLKSGALSQLSAAQSQHEQPLQAAPAAYSANPSSPERGTPSPARKDEAQPDNTPRRQDIPADVEAMLAEERLDEALDRLLIIMMDLGPTPSLVQIIAETRKRIEARNRTLIAQLLASAKEDFEAHRIHEAIEALDRILELEPDRADALELRRKVHAEIEAEKAQQAPMEEEKKEETAKPLPKVEEPVQKRDFSTPEPQSHSSFGTIPSFAPAPEPAKKPGQANKEQWGKQEVENSIAEADKAFERGDLTQCEIQVRRAMVIDPSDSRAKDLLNRVTQIRDSKKKERTAPLLQQGREALAAADFEKAARFAREVLQIDTHSADAQRLIADINKAEADRLKEKIESLLSRSREALHAGEYEYAITLSNEVLAIDAKHQEAKSLIKDIDRMKRISEKELKRQQKESDKTAAVAQTGTMEKSEDEADKTYVVKTVKSRGKYRTLIWMGIGLIGFIALVGGIDWMIQRRNENKKAAELASQINSAQSYLNQNKYEKAIEAVKQILASSPDNGQAKEILSEARKQEKKAAIEELMLKAQMLREQGQYDESLKANQKVLGLDPNYAPAIEARTQILADKEAGNKVAQNSEEARGLLARAGSFLAACKLAESKAEVDKIRSIQDKDIQKRLSNARLLLNSCKLNEAKALVRKAKGSNSNLPGLDSLENQLAAKTSQFSIISKELNRWSETMGTQNEIAELSRKAESLFEQTAYDDCRNILTRLLELAPQNRRAQELRDLTNKARESKKSFEDAMAAKRYDAALKAVARLEEANPLDPGIAGYRQRAEARLKSSKATLSVYRIGEPASLSLDDKSAGFEGEIEKNAVTIGTHKLVIRNNNGQQKTLMLEFGDDQDWTYVYDAATLELRPMVEADRTAIESRKQREKVYNFSAQHSHGLLRGSCNGDLLISALRVEFKPYQGTHAFSYPFQNLRLIINEDKLQFIDVNGNKDLGSYKVSNVDRARKIKDLWNNLEKIARGQMP